MAGVSGCSTMGNGWPISPNMFYKTAAALGERVGIQGMTVHKLRHFNATLAVQSGEIMAEVAVRLGHSSAVVTARHYVHATPDRGMAERLGALVSGERVNSVSTLEPVSATETPVYA